MTDRKLIEAYCALCRSIQIVFEDAEHGMPARRCLTCGLPVGEGTAASPGANGKTVLCIDDSPLFRILLVELLTKSGYVVREAEDGPAGIASARQEPPDVILLDVVMPEMDGFATCAAIKADPRLADIPIVILTALNDPALNERAFRSGALLALHKMARPDTVLLTVAKAISVQTTKRD